ncbi:MAG TPA: hypothetical protein VNO24_07755 [Blastocatellia bacterium]|nr:hypothetical protein [Blastocatellia bacterium]
MWTFVLPGRAVRRRYLKRGKSIILAAVTLAVFVLEPLPYSTALARTGGRLSQPALRRESLRKYDVATSEDFQASLILANPGDVITLQAGALLRGNFFLPEKTKAGAGSDWITIRSSALDETLPPEGVRVTPADATAMATLESPNSQPVLMTLSGAHHYRFEGIEFTIGLDVMLNYGIIRFGEGTETDSTLLPHDLVIDRCYIHGNPTSDVSRGIALNSARTDIVNSYISDCHGLGFDTQAIAGWNGPGPFNIINNYLEAAGENVLFGGSDPKIPYLVPADIEFRNNHCAKPLKWKEGIFAKPTGVVATGSDSAGALVAGSTYYYRISARGRAGYSAIANSIGSDETSVTLTPAQTASNLAWSQGDFATEFRVYRTSDPPSSPTRSWVYYSTSASSFNDVGDSSSARQDSAPPDSGTRWSVKNLFELKNARRVRIDGNVFENNWVDAQSGFGVLFTVRNQDGAAPWSVVEGVSFTNNILRHTAAGINILGRDNLHPSEQVTGVEITGNVFDDVGGSQWGGNGRFLQITETVDVRVDHNTILQTGNIITAYGVPNQGFVFTNNIAPHNDYGIIGDGSSAGVLSIDKYFPASSLKRNVIVGGQSSKYPRKNYYPATLDDVGFVDKGSRNYRLANTSPYKNAGTNGRDIGADLEVVERASMRALQGLP